MSFLYSDVARKKKKKCRCKWAVMNLPVYLFPSSPFPVGECEASAMLPLECQYLNKSALTTLVGPLTPPVKHFQLKRKPKSATLRAELLQKCKAYIHTHILSLHQYQCLLCIPWFAFRIFKIVTVAYKCKEMWVCLQFYSPRPPGSSSPN